MQWNKKITNKTKVDKEQHHSHAAPEPAIELICNLILSIINEVNYYVYKFLFIFPHKYRSKNN